MQQRKQVRRFIVEVRNVGRLAITVSNCAIGIGPKIETGTFSDSRNPSVPCRLDIGDERAWYFDTGTILELAQLAELPDDFIVVGVATIAGKKRHSKSSTTVAALLSALQAAGASTSSPPTMTS